MFNKAKVVFAVALLICMAPLAANAIESYSTDFEDYAVPSEGALLGDGWLVYGNVFGYDWAWWYGYGPYPAPNDGAAFCAIATGEGLGAQCLSVYSDYNNGNHVDGIVESIVYREQAITAGDVGETWVFEFDAKLGNLEGQTTASAFIKTLNPAAGYATTNFVQYDTTAIPTTWGTYSVSLTIDGSLIGQIFQIGFQNFCRLTEGSGVFYDNLNLYIDGPVPAENESWGGVKSLFQ